MNRPLVIADSYRQPGIREELLIVAIALGLTIAALASPLALPLAVGGTVFILAAVRFKPLLLVVVFCLPITPFLNWNFPVRDLSTLVRLSFFAGLVVYRISHHKDLRKWLWSGWLTRALLGYFAVAILSAVFFRSATLDAQRELMRLASYICFYYVITDWVESGEDVAGILKALMASTMLVALFGFYQMVIGGYSNLYDILYPVQDELLQIPPWEGRITSFLEHYNGLAGYLNLVLPFCLGFALRGTDPLLRTLSKWCFVFASIALLFTQSRGGLLAYAAMLVVSACFFAPTRKARMQRIALVVIAAVILGVLAGMFFQRLTEVDEFTTVSRLAIWGGALTVFAGSPLTGIGYGNLRAFLGGLIGLPDGWMGDAHNLYLELLAETGIVGFLVFAMLIVIALRLALKRYRKTTDGFNQNVFDQNVFDQNVFDQIMGFAAFAAVCGVLVHGTVDYLFHTTPQVAALFFMILGMLKVQIPKNLKQIPI
jgi:hypothetical protein